MSQTHVLHRLVKAYDIRGRVGSELDVEVAQALGTAFAHVVGIPERASRIVVGRDMRPSSPQLAAAFAQGVRATGLDVLDIGLASTDQLYYASGSQHVPGAMFTASHNPAGDNGIKLCRAGAAPVGQDSGLTRLRDLAIEILAGEHRSPKVAAGAIARADILDGYARHLHGLVDLSQIRPLRVVVDAANGMAGLTVPAVLGAGALGAAQVAVEPLYFELDGTFPNHQANPLVPENLRDLQDAVVASGADLGLAFDGDADRCFVVDERGEPVSASAITAMIAERQIAQEVARGVDPARIRVVHNVITSSEVPARVSALGAVPIRTRSGHSFIKAEMAAAGAVFGGEHSAHYYFRDFWYADSGMLAALHVLAALGEHTGPLSDLVAPYQGLAVSGEINSRVDDVEAVLARCRAWADAAGDRTDDLDGLTVTRVRADDGGGPGQVLWWFNLRPSNTEPLLRLNVEASTEPVMAAVRDEVLSLVRQ